MDNLFMDMKDTKGLFVDDKARFQKNRELLDRFNCPVSPKALIRELSIAKFPHCNGCSERQGGDTKDVPPCRSGEHEAGQSDFPRSTQKES